MTARPGTYQASNNAGELAPELYGRTDLKQFYSGLAIALNIEPVPQGGSKLAMRTRHIGRIRHKLVTVANGTLSLPSGPYTTAGVIASANFVTSDVSVVVLAGWKASQALGAILQVDYLVGSTWTPLGSPFSMGTETGSVTVALPPGQAVTTGWVRVRLIAAPPSATTFTASSLYTKAETSVMTSGRVRPFTFSLDQTYVAVLMESHVDFYRDGVFVGAATTSFSATQILVIDAPQRLDTMLLFHPDVKSNLIRRDGADNKWLTNFIPFTNIPVVDLGGDYVNQVADVWMLYLRFSTSTGSTHEGGKGIIISINVNGEEAVVTVNGTADFTQAANDMKAAIEGTGSIFPGITVTNNGGASGENNFTISFTGEGNLGSLNLLTAQVVNTGDAAATVSHNTRGDPGGEALFSDTQGYAACASFYQDRLVIGGFKAKKGAFAASETGEYFELNQKVTAASGAILANIDTDGAEQLQRIVSDTYLSLFTSDGEYFISDRAIDRTKPPNIVRSSRYGSAPDLPVLTNEGEIIFASRNKTVLYAGSFDAVSTKYTFNPISLLAPHIVNGMADMAVQRPSGVASAARLWMPRADGTVALGVMLRNQDVTAFVRWETPGSVRSVCVDGKNIPYMLVERLVGGTPELHLERAEEGLIFDDVIEQNFAPKRTIVDGLSMHEGAEVWAQADGYIEGPFTVSSGTITLSTASSNVKVGRWKPPFARTLPLPSEIAERTVLRRPKRVHTVRLDAVDTTSVAVGANDRPARNIALARFGQAADAPPAPISETIVITGMTGFSETGQVDITQTRPGLLAWRGITIEART